MLEDSNIRLAKEFGCENPYVKNPKYNFPLVKDIDPEYDPDTHLYLSGYNSLNYDMTMLALYFAEVFTDRGFEPTTPEIMRAYNDELFSPFFKPCMPDRLKYVYTNDPQDIRRFDTYKIGNKYLKSEGWNTTNPAFYIYKSMQQSGRHIDIARLNEKQSRVALKRLLGMLGLQIMEPTVDLSSKGTSQPFELKDIANLIAYNTSDVIGLKLLSKEGVYESTMALKRQMLLDYPELIFNDDGTYKPDKKSMRRNRLTINSTSAQFAANCLCPYGSLGDIDAVSFNYPSEIKAKELGITQTNVLQDTIDFIETRMRPLVKSPKGQEIIDRLYDVIDMYKTIQGKDFNSSHDEDGHTTYDINFFAERINTPYMDPNGEPADCYVTFSIGGIHGAQYNRKKYQDDVDEFERKQGLYQKVIEQYGDALTLISDIKPNGKPCKRKTVEIDGEIYPVTMFLKSSSTMKKAEFKAEFTNPKRPELFPKDAKGVRKLNDKYKITSFGVVNHEDFTSYYPCMLMNLSAYLNEGLGYDRYEEIFNNKQKFGEMKDDPKYSKEERKKFSIMRNGTKLVLNSASGGSDTNHNSSIRMNNRIISMRIIGQLLAWRIGQAQSLAGAKVVSTNTDGLYTIMEEELNNKILEIESKAAHVGIEPEVMYLVSKDANNRFEGHVTGHTGNSLTDVKVTVASGGSLACRKGPDPTKSLDHPAITDWALTEFLKWKALSGRLDEYVPEIGMKLLTEIASSEISDKKKRMTMFQNVIASSPNTGCYNFATSEPITEQNHLTIQAIPMQHYNRVFCVDPSKVPDDKKDRIYYLSAAYVRINDASDASPLAIKVIRDINKDTEALTRGTPKIKKIKGINQTQPCMIVNEDLDYTDFDTDWLDYNYYNKALQDTYTKNWQNEGEKIVTSDDDDDDEE